MRFLRIKCFIIFVIFFSIHLRSVSQALVPDTASSPAVKNAISFYSTALSEQLHLYNGPEFIEYAQRFEEGHPYFITTAWSKGTVSYDGNTYDDVSIKYDLVSDDVVILGYNKIFKIRLLKEKVAGFSLAGHSFVNIPSDSLLSSDISAGFYDILTTGKLTVLARRTKNIQSYTRQAVEYKVYEKVHYYIRKNNGYIPIPNKSSFLEQFGDKRKEIQRYIKQSRLKFRKDPENTMIKAVEYYNQLTK